MMGISNFKSPHQVPVLREVLSIKNVNCVPENQPMQWFKTHKSTQLDKLSLNIQFRFNFVRVLDIRFSSF